MSEGDTVVIDEWNAVHLSKMPARDCPTLPCQGAYPNNGEDLRNEFNCSLNE